MGFFQFKAKIVPTVSVCKHSRLGTVLPLNTGGEQGGGENPQILPFLFVASLYPGKFGSGMSVGGGGNVRAEFS